MSGRPLVGKFLDRRSVEVVDGHGTRLYGRDGSTYLDTCGGVAVSALGHRHPAIEEAAVTAARQLAWAHAGTFTTQVAEELADHLTSRSACLDAACFLSGGSEAVELALKLALQHHAERGEPDRTTFVSRRRSYHGSTLAALALSGNAARRGCFERSLTTPVSFVSPCYEYRERRAGESRADYVRRLADELDTTITRLGPGRVAAFVAEPVVGSTTGAVPAVPGYLAAMHEVCARHGVLLILDEVMCGLGRTGRYFAFEDDDVRPDVVVVGKGLAAGYAAISGVLASDAVWRPLREGSGVLEHGQTHVNNPVGAAVALAVQRTVTEDGVLDHARSVAPLLRAGLDEVRDALSVVGDVRGRGMFLGLEFVDPVDGSSPLPAGAAFAAHLKATGLEQGLLLYPGHGTADGVSGAHLLVAPALTATGDEIEEMSHGIRTAVRTALSSWARERRRDDVARQ